MNKSVKRVHDYFSENIWYTKLVYMIGGIGVGIIISGPFAGVHPVRWGLAFILLAALLHLYPLLSKRKKG